MKLRSFSPSIFFVLMAMTLVLTACELRADRSDPVQLDAPPLTDPAVVDPNAAPTVDPNSQPAVIDPNAAPTADPNSQPAVVDPNAAPTVDPNTQPATEGETTDPTGEETGPRATSTYVVVSGDTLGQIAQRFDVAIEDIAAANSLTSIDSLAVGQQLIIPGDDFVAPEPTAAPEGQGTTGEQEHVVLAGQTLYSIGVRYGFTVAELQAYNNLANPNVLDVGQVIKIPPSE